MGHSDPPLSSWKQEIDLPCGRDPPCTRRIEDTLITRDREFRAEKPVSTKLVKVTHILLLTSSLFTTHSPNSFVLSILHKCIVSLSKKYKNLLLWSFLQGFRLSWRLPWTCKNSIKFVCFSPINLSYVSLILRPNQRPKQDRGEFFLPYKIEYFLLKLFKLWVTNSFAMRFSLMK